MAAIVHSRLIAVMLKCCLKKNLFQNIESTLKNSSAASPSKSKASSAADPLSLIQGKADTFDGLDPLSMFAAQEATTNKTTTAVTAAVAKKERVCINV